uniref:hypothetical protein n=1 Tax=Thiolapillus sp. TaxID=2017437 RepID=UPI003AF71AAD
MDDSLAFCDQSLIDSGKPATHAVVIGVGAYPHLNGGDPAALTDLHGGLGQLSSPPVSARTITDWLLDSFNNPDKPLASVSLLVSEEEGGQVYHHDSRCQPWRAKRRLVDPSSREAALFSRRALRQRENKVGLRTRR